MGSLVEPRSLAETVDRVTDAFLADRPPGKARCRAAARFIASRQGLPGSYSGMFAPTEVDWGRDLRLYTGERVKTRAGRAHILSEEAYRALLLLAIDTGSVHRALGEAQLALIPHLEQTERWQKEKRGALQGEFCCGTCSVSLWRTLVAGGFAEIGAERWLAAGIRTLDAHRDDSGGWGRFPFWYTLLALDDLHARGAPAARRHAAPKLERVLRRRPKSEDRYDARRRSLAARILARC